MALARLRTWRKVHAVLPRTAIRNASWRLTCTASCDFNTISSSSSPRRAAELTSSRGSCRPASERAVAQRRGFRDPLDDAAHLFVAHVAAVFCGQRQVGLRDHANATAAVIDHYDAADLAIAH